MNIKVAAFTVSGKSIITRTNMHTIYTLTLLRPIEFSIKLQTIKSGWSIVYIVGSHVVFSKKNILNKSDNATPELFSIYIHNDASQ